MKKFRLSLALIWFLPVLCAVGKADGPIGGINSSAPIGMVRLTAQLTSSPTFPPDDNPVEGVASLLLGNPFRQAGVSNVLLTDIEVGFVMPKDIDFQFGPTTFEDEAGNAITNLASAPTDPHNIFPGPIPEASDLWAGVEFSYGPFQLTSEQIAQLLAGQWFLHVRFLKTSGEAYPETDIQGRIQPVDSDGDGVPDYRDHCPGTPTGEVVDENGCSIAQLCPCEEEWKSHGDYTACVNETVARFQTEGLITAAAKRAIVQSAANSDCGHKLTPDAPFSGITGQSLIVPYWPSPGPPSCACPPVYLPHPTSIKIYSGSGVLVTEILTDAQGDFRASLKEGVYTLFPWVLDPPPPSPYPYVDPFTVTVPFKQFTNVVVLYEYRWSQ